MRLLSIVLIALFVVGVIWFIFAVDHTVIREGKVISKRYTPASSYVQIMPITTTNGKITATTLVPITQYISESWSLKISKQIKNKIYVRTISVSESFFNGIEAGEWVTVSKEK